MNITPQILEHWLEASNLSRQQFIQKYAIPPLVYVPRMPDTLQPVFGVLYVLIFILALTGNAVVLLLLCQRKAAQSPSTLFISSLALSDILISLCCLPATCFQNFFTNWLASDFLCKLVPFSQVTAVTASILTLTCIAVERFHGILYPMRFQNSCSTHHATKMLLAVWLVALAVAAPMGYAQRVEVKYDFLFDVRYICCQEVWPHNQQRRAYTTVLSVLLFLIPMATMAVLYFKIIRELWGKHRVHAIMLETLESEISKITRRKRRAVRMMVTVVLLFGVCWAPFHLVSLLSDYGMLHLNSDSEFVVFSVVQLLGFSNSVCNPVVYVTLGDNFKKDLVGRLVRARKRAWLPTCCLRGRSRVDVWVVEPPGLRRRSEQSTLEVELHQWNREAWGPGLGPEPASSSPFPRVHLFRACCKKSSSPLLLSVTDPLHNSTPDI
ncbi:QRFP-like peptide receptor [Megalops cyprinoides]|uniref:QRFP-like peptide receptor n=1 Tax=Megalops cyprinoides TaxID=118141 RepID=UPI00186402FB|nr:QRFP-like peptide receptor [Megalops cyprinoides]